jgi:FkbM family methyltransferase
MFTMHRKYVKEIVEHPLNRDNKFAAFGKYLAWNVGRRLLHQAAYAIELVPGATVVLSNHENYATLAYTCGLYDFEDMLFVMHALGQHDCFGDFGANVGIYSALAGLRGASVLAVEPVPYTYRRLCANLRFNSVNAIPVNCGLSDRQGMLTFTTDRGGMNKVAKPGHKNTCQVAVVTVDQLVAQTRLSPHIVKIDVEGYEYPLLAGATNLFASTLHAIVIELNGSGREYGYSDETVHALIVSRGFAPYRYIPERRELVPRDGFNRNSFNTIYAKNTAVDSLRKKLGNRAI